MKPHEVQPEIRKHGLSPVWLILGEEDYLRTRALEDIQAGMRSAGRGESNGEEAQSLPTTEVLFGDETDASEILARLLEVPLFGERSFVVVKWAEKLSARHGEELIPYLKKLSATSTVVFMAAKLDGRQKWVQALKKCAMVVDCAPLYDNQRLAWVKQEATRLGVNLSPDAAQMLKDVAGDGLGIVRQELDKLMNYVPQGARIEAKDVEALQGVDPGASVFDLAAAIGSKNTGMALSILGKNLEAGEAPLRILGSLLWQYRRIWRARDCLAQGVPEGKVAHPLGIPPFRQREFFSLVHKFTETHLRAAFQLFVQTDAALKGAKAGQPRVVLETLLLTLCGI